MSAAPILTVNHVEMRFGGLRAIADLHFDVAEGEILSLIGPNGAGKTTAFNIITGYLKPTSGEVCFRGTNLAGLSPNRVSRLGLARTFQRTSVFANDTVFDNVMLALHGAAHGAGVLDALFNLPRERRGEARRRERTAEILDQLGLTSRAYAPAGSLSYGEQRLVGVALALATDPTMLLLDEPVSGMNASETHNFVRLIRAIRDAGTTILLVEHDMPMVMAVSDRIVCLNHGQLIANAPPAEIRTNPAVIEAYLGKSAATTRIEEELAHA
ncbi:ABC transporter ATP-binding protein [Terrihabitans rhizophilus]|uniref:ABC transporter ATP-binding protein n=1 Tax=Terrihabitans rhizophilus TaxID=3092662 RepID=A0ABU4RN39_9HYPH|nr:ABC transporter ATP-binding protein [Terrihabitans sp. PJ23]MDX6806242.1 ABC transporter ATP-binding protein [Terrihabitans sp. PJ23]